MTISRKVANINHTVGPYSIKKYELDSQLFYSSVQSRLERTDKRFTTIIREEHSRV